LLYSFDVSAYGRRGSPDDPVVAIGGLKTTPNTDQKPSPGVFVLQKWYSQRTGNVAAGVEYRFHDFVIVRGGLFTDLSGAPSLPKRSNIYRPTDVNRVGATFSLGVLRGGYDVSLGVVSSFGWGKTLGLFAGEIDEVSYRRTSIHEASLFIFLSGARAAVGRLADDAYKMLKERRAD
jgi:hypothetical protein